MDFIEQIMGVFTIPALITVVLSILPVNAMAMYSGGLATLAMGLPLKRWISAILIALIGAVLILFNSGESQSATLTFSSCSPTGSSPGSVSCIPIPRGETAT